MKSGYVNTNGIRIHYERTGGDLPPVVLLHGLTDSGRCWPGVAPLLAKAYDVVTVDQRGHGLSDRPASGYTREEQAADLAGVIEALGLGRPRLVGHSMGAGVVAALAAGCPHLARCVVLEDPPWRTPAAVEASRAGLVAWREELVAMKAMPLDDVIALGRAAHRWPEHAWRPWAEAKQQVSLDAFDGYLHEVHAAPWRAVAAGVTCPALLITGAPELGAIVTPETAAEVVALWREGEHVHVDGVGHNVRREAPERYAAAVMAFLAKEILDTDFHG